jgi:hypothetical protein
MVETDTNKVVDSLIFVTDLAFSALPIATSFRSDVISFILEVSISSRLFLIVLIF